MRKALILLVAFGLCWASLGPAMSAFARPNSPAGAQDESSYQEYTPDQLDNLLGPIALYPDPLLAQVLVAATFPDQIDDAARYVRAYGQNGVDDQSWDVSVRAVAHYPEVLQMMDDNLDWTTALGQAYVYQSTDVVTSIQRLRAMAQQQGNLVSTPQQEVVEQNGGICIWPASPEYIYVPVYDPSIVFFRPAHYGGSFIGFSFGSALRIGVWLNIDFNWGEHRVYYTGWRGGGWIGRSRPDIHDDSRYINNRYSVIVVNRAVSQRPVNYQDLSRYHGVHNNVTFENRSGGASPSGQQPFTTNNKIINRNIMPNQPINQFRGREATPPASTTRPVEVQPRQAPTETRQPARGYTPSREPAPVAQTPAPQPPNAFGRGDSQFNSRQASQRGQQSRAQMNQRPARQPAPKAQPAPKSQPSRGGQQRGRGPGKRGGR